ncbi:MAG: SlyX family protein [Pseudomonadales bacterium]|nr:SlyX protein [Gammaproteobacteria bacterium]MCH1555521.1 SlyX family protein [Pseudomonadales bacterium]RPG53250.1 MAG: SlyX family protein [Gammaproteobacteria bacterium TMED182]
MSDPEKIAELEMKLAFQEDQLQKLEEAVLTQQRQILALEDSVRLLSDQLKQINQGDTKSPEGPPPHY